MLLQQFLTEHSVSVARLCAGMRRARPNMVPTPRHYALLYDLLYEAGIGGQSLIDLNVRSGLKSEARHRGTPDTQPSPFNFITLNAPAYVTRSSAVLQQE
ncbi:unnamed protein product [Dibothriocephalus latus]|uniref:Uncharacterized protein n=1 Tax=Dibothriocephalus latus TaxID=60516 RepID=A0A3P7L596_DIBLA|nr:unnamed protein product [Dibothriocephalus latus]